MNNTAIIIPARYASTRLQGKPLLEVNNKPIIQWVWEKALKSQLADQIIIATDNDEIYDAALNFGAQAEMTSPHHQSGSDRIAEIVERHPEIAYIVNLQGDEPLIKPESLDELIKILHSDSSVDISTLVRELSDSKSIDNPNIVKVVRDNNDFALYFSRSRIPYERNEGHVKYYGHLGVYGYKRESLLKMTGLNQSSLELAESLEQLRALQNGMRIKTALVDFTPVGIDTVEDLEEFRRIINSQNY